MFFFISLILVSIFPLSVLILFICILSLSIFFFLVTQLVKNLPAMRETWVRSLGQEDPLENGMEPYTSILAWKIPWTQEPGGL